MKRLVLLAVFAATMAFAPKAEAAFITGGVSFGGAAVPSGGATWATATGIDFGNSAPNAAVTGGSGSYAGIPFLTPVTFADFTFSPSLSPTPVAPLWTFVSGGLTYSFTMTGLGQVQQGFNNGSSFLLLHGTGMLSITGLQDTAGIFDFSGQDSNLNFSFSASNAAVPEPGSMVLLGTGLLGLATIARRRMKKA